jgi:hypothetical protein
MKSTLIKILLINLISLTTFCQSNSDFPMLQLQTSDWNLSNTKWKTAKTIGIHPEKNSITQSSGDEILVGQNGSGQISSKVELADLKIKFDFMLDKNSDNVLYLMGKYGIVLSNSYENKAKPIGSLIKPNGGFELPNQNACKATGLWQNIEIVFASKSTSSQAIIEKIVLNGIIIHQNFVFSDPSNNSPITNTNSKGPIIINNIAGTIALKNINYLNFGDSKPISISNISYEIQETNGWDKTFEVKNTPLIKGTAEELTLDLPHSYQNFIVSYNGNMKVAKDGKYAFTIEYLGVASLSIDGKEVCGSKEYSYRIPLTALVDLKEGNHTFTYKYQKIWWRPALGLFVAGGDFRPYALHPAGLLPLPESVGEVAIAPKGSYEIQRSFIMFENKKRTHVISVGSPSQVHYTLDLNQGAPLYYWRGDFADVTEMWFERGEPQLFKPKGLLNKSFGKPNVFQLKNEAESSPDSLDAFNEIIYQSYKLDESGNPTFYFKENETTISQKFTPQNQGLKHEVTVNGGSNFYLKIAEGKDIEKLDKQLIRIDNQFVKLPKGTKTVIRNNEILVPISGTFSYEINW